MVRFEIRKRGRGEGSGRGGRSLKNRTNPWSARYKLMKIPEAYLSAIDDRCNLVIIWDVYTTNKFMVSGDYRITYQVYEKIER